ncbi:hypothetical protein QLL95_gp1009 [Cotonvirus japonicus]|uniref:Uncharacterized protein n=1 Tax=Cotonvirus japonicus TaxID=2811091 RepID=A0ABM7NSH5_9VIRU|nr:hypothetical protein QLL95_gp1009 [Cotonvirus japonicus]BCS83114.1 hypothetical protein [Cotonvirus japonicus]
MNNKTKYKIISSIEDDAPFGDVNLCTISFVTAEKIEKIKNLDIKAFKVHNGYTTLETANFDVKKLRTNNPNHDVYVSQIGKLYQWDDATKSDSIEYDDKKLNDLEKTRKENIDKVKLMQEQFNNEYKTIYANDNNNRTNNQKKKLRDKLYEKGCITKEEYDMIKKFDKSTNEIKDLAAMQTKIDQESSECSSVDYLDENPPTALKYGCITFYSPTSIKNLKNLCFKVRGLFETPRELNKRVAKLEKLYPNDKIYTFEIGKWCPYSETYTDLSVALKYTNYCMKIYLENLENEKEAFEKRKNDLQTKTENESNIIKASNRQQKRREKREKERLNRKNQLAKQTTQSNSVSSSTTINEQTIDQTNNEVDTRVDVIGDGTDNNAIKNIMDYITN